MKIYINDWSRSNQLDGTPYYNNMEIDGSNEDVIHIMNDMFNLGFDVQVYRFKIDPELVFERSITDINAVHIWADKKQFKSSLATFY